ncbi:hypothetical protein CHS0354_004947 [Potamilus streckersoni]|uniref:Tenascin-X n=1 Tax=Potamilus streckersoni TaxID=2493646 RepID=A0AAE0VH41_9BIVA|nr:hypothetical protein CHS0354_004947 [Potamilus streckersoni]
MFSTPYHQGGSGGGHGGRGGRSKGGYFSAYTYDSIYFPSQMGSGGGTGTSNSNFGGRGGGIIFMHIQDELRVEGRLHANGEAGGSYSGGGGAGGSLYLNVQHLDGAGSIEAIGGAGGQQAGGGGGGRIAIYHTKVNHFTGDLLIHGGYGSDQFGGSGTVYIEDQSNLTKIYRKLITDNRGKTSCQRIAEVEKLSLEGHWSWSSTYFSYGNVSLSTFSPIYDSSYGLANLVTGSTGDFFMGHSKHVQLEVTFPFLTYVDHIRVFPYCSNPSWITSYSVGSYGEDGTLVGHTDSYVKTDGCSTQQEPNQYGRIIIRRNVVKIIIELEGVNSVAVLSELEIYVSEDPETWQQTPYSNREGAAYIIESDEHTGLFEFDEVHILGGASLNLESDSNKGTPVKLVAHKVFGDNTGRLTVRHGQTYESTQDRVLQEFAILSQRHSSVSLPLTVDCRKIDLVIKGSFSSMENVTINANCSFTIDHHEPTRNVIDHLDIKSFASVHVLTDMEAQTTLVGTTLTVRSGAEIFSNDLVLEYTNITVEPYGRLYVDEGVPEREQNTGVGVGHSDPNGCSGGGHGGNGGQGQGQPLSGGSHGSFLLSDTFGKNGGHSTFPHLGGLGGGRLKFKVNHTLTVDGEVTANGGDWRSVEAGGGSGGSISIETYTIDGGGIIDASGGNGYGGMYASHGGGGGGGRIALYYTYNYYIGTFRNTGGAGGAGAEHGGAGTVYLHKLPDLLSNGQVAPDFTHNRTLYLDNMNRFPRNPLRNLTQFYTNYSLGSGVAWIFPGFYPSFVKPIFSPVDFTSDVILDHLQIYRGAQMAMVRPENPRQNINLSVGSFDGDRSGHLHVGYNQTLLIGTGRLPVDVSLYHGSETTLQGELRVAGVTVMVEGTLKNVENLTVVDGGNVIQRPKTPLFS